MDYFPLTIAQGTAFCNRKKELAELKSNIELAKPTLLASPRRFGKTSLVLKAVKQTKLPYVQLDFLTAVDEQDVEQIVLKGVGQLIGKMEKGVKKALNIAIEFFSGLNIQVSVDKLGLSVDIKKKSKKPVKTILNVLERLEELTDKHKEKVVLFFDEFQQVGEITNNTALESAICEVAQRAKNIVFIFSGSNRHLLNEMFNDKKRPFYRMCERIELHRIDRKAYLPYIRRAAKRQWDDKLSKEVIENILDNTECHSYYTNMLCSLLWRSTSMPTKNDVEKTWKRYVEQERSQVSYELDLLSKNQRKLLIALIREEGTDTPRGVEFITASRMSNATIGQSLGFLVKKDYVYKTIEGEYRVLDPLTRSVIAASIV